MTDTKPWFASQTIIAGTLGAIASVLGAVELLRPGLIPVDLIASFKSPETAAAFVLIGTLVTSVWSVVGRLRATKPIEGKIAKMVGGAK
jgi:membrane associated rhomboid family serine protease